MGEEHTGQQAKLVMSGTDAVIHIIQAVEGAVLQVWTGIDLSDIEKPLLDLVQRSMDFDAIDPADDLAVLGLLPNFRDLAAGWQLTDEQVDREFTNN